MSYPNKTQFVKIVEAIDKARTRDSEFSEVLTEYLQHHTIICTNDKLLSDMCEFIDGLFGCCGYTSFYLLDLDAGRVRIEGKEYFKDAGELYDALTKEK